jgi:hypothetical protein
MAYDIQNNNLELLIYDKVGKNINYYPKSELSVSASNGNIIITQTVGESSNTIFSQEASMIDQPSNNSIYDLVTTIKGYIGTELPDSFSGGWADYEDVATTGTPIAVSAVPAVLTNDGLGVDTNTSYLPVGGNGITQLWDTSSNGFDFSDLEVGDMVDIRMDITMIITSNNTAVDVDLYMGSGGSIVVPFISQQNFKSTGSFEVIRYMGIYIGSEDVRDNLAQLKVSADNNCTCTVHGWYIKAIRRGS